MRRVSTHDAGHGSVLPGFCLNRVELARLLFQQQSSRLDARCTLMARRLAKDSRLD